MYPSSGTHLSKADCRASAVGSFVLTYIYHLVKWHALFGMLVVLSCDSRM